MNIEMDEYDITKFDEVTLLPLEKCLLMLAYMADRAEVEELVHKAAMKRAGGK